MIDINYGNKKDNEYLQMIKKCPKTDLHSHAGRGGSVKYISKWTQTDIPKPPKKFDSLSHMQQWYVDNIRYLTAGEKGQVMRWKAAFCQANDDNIEFLALSFARGEVELVGGMEKFIQILQSLKQEFAPSTLFLPELTFDRACDVDKEMEQIDELLSYNFFRSIDICCNEFAQPIKNFKPLYQKAKDNGLRLVAHVGEFGTADDVMEAVEELELNGVHHGIAAAKSQFVTQWLVKNKIQLNICPTSNVMLRVVDEYKNHPIQKLYRSGVPVTINTDDLMIFNQSVSEEYNNLYKAGTLNIEELEQIRLNGLSVLYT